MQPQDPLAELRDIHLPEPVSFWPPAPGWWILAILILLFVGFCGWQLWKWRLRRRPKREALQLLKEMQEQFEFTLEPMQAVRDLSQLIRRVALTSFQQENVASLHGEKWLEFLDKTGKTTDFSKGVGKVLGDQLYQKEMHESDVNLSELFPLVRKWIKSNQPETNP